MARGSVASVQVDIYSFRKANKARLALQKESGGGGVQHNNNLADYQQVQAELRLCVFFGVNASVFQQLSHGPRLLQGSKKSLIQNHPGGLLLEGESLAGFAN